LWLFDSPGVKSRLADAAEAELQALKNVRDVEGYGNRI
jgi:hypothetical protein